MKRNDKHHPTHSNAQPTPSPFESPKTTGVPVEPEVLAQRFRPGDWLQATGDVFDDGELVARAGDVGHVLDMVEDLVPNVYFERTGRVTICFLREVKFLAHADAGRTPFKVDINVN